MDDMVLLTEVSRLDTGPWYGLPGDG